MNFKPHNNSKESGKLGKSLFLIFKRQKYVLIFVLIIFLTPTLFLAIDFFNLNSYIGFTINYDWLGFFGGFLGGTFGGVATFMGVYLTLKYHKNADYEKNRLSIIPILEYKIRYNKDDFDNSMGQLSDEGGFPHINIKNATYQDMNSLEWYFNLIISNVGMGHAQISGISFVFVNANNHEEIIEKEEFGYTFKLVKKDHDMSFKFMIYAPDENPNDSLYGLKINIKYQDLLGNKYEQLAHAAIANSGRINSAHLHYYENFKDLK
ncbi:hypothetical protein KM915_03635 [Cytobacillus oceanisediminis]|uniref:hypothetical protein n=1 Tax=Cytobacillus oceanisediminis TaxID=665099 RepID=UPI001C21CD9C|nr:hypothetical protein [Cytobacillus oceanisediminis]MBU8729147.1 hypothetical protein [Cytobacillus oceanisediminis]